MAKVLSLYYTHKPGGFCKRLYRLLGAVADRGHEVYYLTLDPPPAQFPGSVSIVHIPFFTKKRRGLLFWACFTLWCPLFTAWKALRLKPDQYVVFGAYYGAMARFARIFHPVPIVLFLRSLVFRVDVLVGKPWIVRVFARAVDRFGILGADHVVCMTQAMRAECESFLGRELPSVSILPNDVPQIAMRDLPSRDTALKKIEHAGLTPESFVVLTSGVIDERKNIGLLLEAFSVLEKSLEPLPVVLVIAGDGPLLEVFQAESARRGMKTVHFLGWTSELLNIYPAVDLVVHPSLHEGVPNSVLEPIALGIPVLVSNIPELRELLEHAELLVDPLDPGALARRIERVYRDRGYLQTLRDLCQERGKVFRFDWEERACEAMGLGYEKGTDTFSHTDSGSSSA